MINVVFVSYDEIDEIIKRLYEFEISSNLIKVYILEAKNFERSVKVINFHKFNFSVECFKVKPQPCTGQHHATDLVPLNLTENILILDADETMKLSNDALAEMESAEKLAFKRRNFFGSYEFKGSGLGPKQDLQVRYLKKLRIKPGIVKVHQYPYEMENYKVAKFSEIEHYSYKDWSDVLLKFNRYTTLEMEKYSDKTNVPYLLYRAIKHFIRRFVFEKGYKDGVYGLAFCLLMACYLPISAAKYKFNKK